MRRTLSLLLAALMLAVPSAAFAQSAGDEQYADPFGQTGQGGQGGQNGGSQDEPAQNGAPAVVQTQSDELDSSQPDIEQTSGTTLPATGLPVGLLAGTGALLLAAGTTLRRRTS